MPTTCWNSVNGEVMRLTRLDNCGRPLAPAAACAQIVSDGFVSVAYSAEITEGEDIERKNARGAVCLSKAQCDELKYFNVQINACGVDPDMFSFITGSPLVLDWNGNSVGNRIKKGSTCNINFALELWTEIPSEICEEDVDGQWGYFLVPFISGGVLGDFTIQNDALDIQFNSKSKSGSGWGVGPYAVDQEDALGTAGPLLLPIESDDLMDIHLTTIAPPTPVCGCQAMPAALP